MLGYPVILGTFRGDWFTAAERYRAWAVNRPGPERAGCRRRPDWVLETGLWVWNRGRSPGVLGPAVALPRSSACR